MGLRINKVIKIGPFNINISKSGIGFSFGVKGVRVAKTAKGKTRVTASIPKSGISWVEEFGKKTKNR